MYLKRVICILNIANKLLAIHDCRYIKITQLYSDLLIDVLSVFSQVVDKIIRSTCEELLDFKELIIPQ